MLRASGGCERIGRGDGGGGGSGSGCFAVGSVRRGRRLLCLRLLRLLGLRLACAAALAAGGPCWSAQRRRLTPRPLSFQAHRLPHRSLAAAPLGLRSRAGGAQADADRDRGPSRVHLAPAALRAAALIRTASAARRRWRAGGGSPPPLCGRRQHR